MRYAGPVRREIGIRTVFNILGPLTNPAHAQCMLLGVAYEQLGGLMAQALRLLDIRHALVVHGADGMDEISLSGPSTVWEVQGGAVSTWTIDLADTGLASASTEDLHGGVAEENAATMRRLFQGRGRPNSRCGASQQRRRAGGRGQGRQPGAGDINGSRKPLTAARPWPG